MTRYMIGFNLLVVMAGPVLAAPAAPPAWVAPLRLPDGIADATGKQGFIANDKNTVDAVNLETGEVLWTADVPGTPLAVLGTRLAVQVPVKGKSNAVRIL